MESQRIIKNLNANIFSTVLDDIQCLISGAKNVDCSEMCSLLRAIYQAVVPSSLDAENEDKKQIIFNFIPSINLCLDHAEKSYSFSDLVKCQFFPLLYHIIRAFLKAQLYRPAISCGDTMRNLLADKECVFDDKSTYVKNLRVLFWNEALQVEKNSNTYDPEIPFVLRTASIEFYIFEEVCFNTVHEHINLNLIRYCQNDNINTELLAKFLQNMWTKLQHLYCTFDHNTSLHKVLCNWFDILLKYLKDISFMKHFVDWFQDLFDCTNKVKDLKLLNACARLSKICIQYFILQEDVTKLKKIFSQHVEYCKNRKQLNNAESEVLAHTCSIFYSSFSKYLYFIKSLEQDNIVEVKSNMDLCISLVKFCVNMPCEEQKEKYSSCLVVKFNLCVSLAGLFLKLIKKDSERKQLVKEAEMFLKFSFSKLSDRAGMDAVSKSVIGLVSSIASIGVCLYNMTLYSESHSVMEIADNFFSLISSTPEYNSVESQEMLWRIHEVLIYDCFLSGCHEKALDVIAKSLTVHEKKTKECFELWRKVKKDAVRNGKEHLMSIIITDIMLNTNIKVDLETEIKFLTEEFRICKSERHNFDEEIIAVAMKLLSVECSGIAKAWVLLETVTLPANISEKLSADLKKSLAELCVESINLYQDYISKNPSDYSAKLYLSIAYFWLYHATLKKIHDIAEEETRNILNPVVPVPKTEVQNDVEEENDTCDIQPIHPLVSLSVEEETLKNLEFTISLWNEIPVSIWPNLTHIVKDKNVLDVIQATAEIYSTAAHDLKELKLWLLLQSASIATESKFHEFIACISLTNLLTRLGYLQIASYFLEIAEFSFKLCNNNDIETLQLKYHITKSNFLLHTGKFDEGLKLLQDVLSSSTLEKRVKSAKILHVESLLLLSEYVLLPSNTFSNQDSIEYLRVNSHLASLMEAVAICKALVKHMTEKQASHLKEFDWICFVPFLIKMLLKASLHLSEFYFKAGEPRFARCYLQDALKVAESRILTFWSSKILLVLGYVDLICDNFKDCHVKASGLKYIFDGDGKQSALELLIQMQEKYSSSSLAEPLTPNSPELILCDVPEINLSRHLKQTFIDKINVMSSPTSKRKPKNDSAKYINFKYSDDRFSIGLVQLESSVLSCLLSQKEDSIKESTTILEELLDQYDKLKNMDNFRNVLASLELSCSLEDPLSRWHSKSEVLLFINILLQMLKTYCITNDSRNAKKIISHAFSFLQEASSSPEYFYYETYALVKYHDIRISLCEHLKVPFHSSSTYYLCPSVKSNASLKKSSVEKSNLVVLPSTPYQKNIPTITINNDSITGGKCQAPLKKNLLNSNLKKDIELCNIAGNCKSAGSPFVIFSSSDEEIFESPYDSFSRASKSRSSQKKKKKDSKSTDKTVSYQIFKSKNDTLSVKDASDVWNLPLAETPKLGKENRKLRSTKRILKTTHELKQKSQSTVSEKNKQRNGGSKPRRAKDNSTVLTNSNGPVDSLKQNKSSFAANLPERQMSVELSRCSPYGAVHEVSRNVERASSVDICKDSHLSEVFFTPSSVKIKTMKIPNLLDDLCKNMSTLNLAKKNSPSVAIKNLDKVIKELDDARILLLNSLPYPLYPNICRLLAILKLLKQSSVPENGKELECSFLLSESFSVTLRNAYITNMIFFKDPEISKEREIVFNIVKKPSSDITVQMESFLRAIPDNWTVVQLSAFHPQEYLSASGEISCPTKLVMCQYRKNSTPLIVGSDCSSDEKFSSSFLSEFQKILQESSLTMLQKDSKIWWHTRSSLDIRLKSFIDCMENVWLGCWKGLFLGVPQNEERIEQLEKTVDTIVEFSSFADKKLLQILIDSAQHLSKEQVSAAVCYLWNCCPEDGIHKKLCQSIRNLSISLPHTERHPVILILDQSLQALPWECMPILNGASVSRMPSLSILHCKLAMFNTESVLYRGIDTSKTYYVLNPGGDLLKSQECFQEQFEKQPMWNGITGKSPSVKEYISAFKDHELFIYCGHGSGRKYFENTSVDRLRLQSATILMGCSSGKLSRLGRLLESHGIVLRLLLSGCPSITANLWDVTDKDIDRFTEKLLQSLIPNYDGLKCNKHNVAKAASIARSACKMPYLVGAAPVVYGFPVFAKIK